MFFFSVSLLGEQMSLEPLESSTTQMFFQILHFFLDHKDRYHVINGELFNWCSFVWYKGDIMWIHAIANP